MGVHTLYTGHAAGRMFIGEEGRRVSCPMTDVQVARTGLPVVLKLNFSTGLMETAGHMCIGQILQ